MLNTEQNTHVMERRVMRAAKEKLGLRKVLASFFEHGQWWIEDRKSGAQWSVCDTDTGFDFEQVTQGDEE